MNPAERIAIVGLGGVFPGALDLDQFWANIGGGVDCGRHVPPGRWLLPPREVFDPIGPQVDRVYSTWGYFVEGFEFDPEGLQLDSALVRQLDPVYHFALHAARQAWRSAVTSQLNLARVGVVLGNIVLPTESASALARDSLGRTFEEQLFGRVVRTPASGVPPINRYVAGLPAGLVAMALGLGGPAFTLDAACASSLYALKFACDELLAGRTDAMLAGGLSRPDSLYTQMGFSQLQALSKRGRCSPLSAEADGLVVGEGAGVFVLKRLSDALRDGDQIHATIAGIGLSNDRGGNILAPRSEGQLRAMRAAYRQADWSPSDVDLIECHATGTPVGDAVELESLHQLWQEEATRVGQCALGCVKGNVGHLLTGAGAAGLMKVLLALQHKTLPPTANFTHPAAALTKDSPFRVLTQPQPWEPRPGQPRRATVNAFGFGGINAHVLVEEWNAETSRRSRGVSPRTGPARPGSVSDEPIAVVGLGAHFGPWESVREIERRLFGEDKAELSSPQWWGAERTEWFRHEGFADRDWRGFYVNRLRIPTDRFRIPPVELSEMLPQQLLMLQVAADALADAGLGRDLGDRTGVFIGIGLDLNTTNYHVRWSLQQHTAEWARELGIDLSSEEFAAWLKQLRDASGPPLTANRTMGGLGAITASRIAREFGVGGPSFTVSSEQTSGLRAVETAVRLLQRGELDRAIVGAVDLAGDVRAVLAAHAAQSLADGAMIGEGAAAVILKRLSDAERDGDRIDAVIEDVRSATHGLAANHPPQPPLGTGGEQESRAVTICAEGDIGDTGAASGLASLVKGVLCLRRELLPATRGESSGPTYWLRNRAEGPRRAAIPSSGVDGTRIEVLLQGYEGASARPVHQTPFLETMPDALFVIEGDSLAEVRAGVERLHSLSNGSDAPVETLARLWLRENPLRAEKQLGLSLLARDRDELRRHCERITREGIVPSERVLFTEEPLGRAGELAFVFPGSGNHFVGMGRELFARWPDVLRQQDRENEFLREQFRPDLMWDAASSDALNRDHKAMIYCQVALGSAVTDLMMRFGVRPRATIGYSLGESSALFASRAWPERDEMLRRMHASPLFGSELVAPFDAVRRAWHVPPSEPVEWVCGLVDRSAEEIQHALQAHGPRSVGLSALQQRVYLLIVNTPTQCVIGGERAAVEQFVRDLKAMFVPFAAPSAVHCPILDAVAAAYRELHLMRTAPPSEVRFYSTAWGKHYSPTRKSAADAILAQARRTIDFPKVIEAAYAEGVRAFVEIGPGASCTRMIREILGSRPHIAEAVCVPRENAVTSLLRVLGRLVTHRTSVDFSPLYGDEPVAEPHPSQSHRCIEVPVGGDPFHMPPLPRTQRPEQSSLSPEREGLSTQCPASSHASHNGNGHMEIGESSGEPDSLIGQLAATVAAGAEAHEVFLRFSSDLMQASARQIERQFALLQSDSDAILCPTDESEGDDRSVISVQVAKAASRVGQAFQPAIREGSDVLPRQAGKPAPHGFTNPTTNSLSTLIPKQDPTPRSHTPQPPLGTGEEPEGAVQLEDHIPTEPPRRLNRKQCLEFAVGSIGKVLGKMFAEADQFPTRVRLPDEPLMLVDRITAIEGEPLSMRTGRVVTEHDVLPNGWYLDGGRIPTCVSIEAGQADLFLSGYLGIDLETRGLAVYRLLDAAVTFHRSLPGPGEVIQYDIRIKHFFRQGETRLFRFEFDATVNGEPLMTMREGCAGFFTPQELAAGKGVVHTPLAQQPRPGKRPDDWRDLVLMRVECYDDAQIDALRRGDLTACFGSAFANLPVHQPLTLPGGRMKLVDRVLQLDPHGGRFGMGLIRAEADIHPDDWFLTCHFCDDNVMPGTLMYECCLHTLRIFLLRMGWIGEQGQVVFEPVPGVTSRLKCRGQVIATTKKAWYEVTLKELGYGPEPYCLADAVMYADGKPVVDVTDMSVRLSGTTREQIEQLWSAATLGERRGVSPPCQGVANRPAVFNRDRILAFATGKPSEGFGDRYQPFDSGRFIARLPGPPFSFLDRITDIQGEPWKMQAGGRAESQYDVPSDAWYFAANRQPVMPFAVLMEISLQTCGWMSAYVGSALASDSDLHYRNLGGTAVRHAAVTPETGTLTTIARMTKCSNSGGMIIQQFDFETRSDHGPVYCGNTYFGFFSKAALAQQVGLRELMWHQPTEVELSQGRSFPIPSAAPFPDEQFRMIDRIERLVPNGGRHGLGFLRGTATVNPQAWFFQAHFLGDPVWPGSLGLESLLQLLKVYAAERWGADPRSIFQTPALGQSHEWIYRGQVIPTHKLVTVEAELTAVDDAARLLVADGILSVDGRAIYQMKGFSLRMA